MQVQVGCGFWMWIMFDSEMLKNKTDEKGKKIYLKRKNNI